MSERPTEQQKTTRKRKQTAAQQRGTEGQQGGSFSEGFKTERQLYPDGKAPCCGCSLRGLPHEDVCDCRCHENARFIRKFSI